MNQVMHARVDSNLMDFVSHLVSNILKHSSNISLIHRLLQQQCEAVSGDTTHYRNLVFFKIKASVARIIQKDPLNVYNVNLIVKNKNVI